VLDDGFQHRRIARDLDAVLIDATRDPFADALLPAGWLREPVESLRRAHAVVITHAESVEAPVVRRIGERARAINPALLVATARHEWSALTVAERAGELEHPVEWLRRKRVAVSCGIGNPGPFLAAVERAGATIVGKMVRPDHDPYSPATARRLGALARGTDALVVTEKDWSKLSRRAIEWPVPVVRPRLRIRFATGGDELRNLVLQCVGDALARERAAEQD